MTRTSSAFALAALVAAAAALPTAAAPAQAWGPHSKLLAVDGQAGDAFGVDLSLHGDRVLVGAYHDDDRGAEAGSAYLFRYDPIANTWLQEAKLLPSDGADGDNFGESVSLHGELALVGSERHDPGLADAGAAYVFRYDSLAGQWVQEAKLLAGDAAAGDFFGESVSLHGELALVGAQKDDDRGQDSGSAYLFRYDTVAGGWQEIGKLGASDGQAGDQFGKCVSLAGDVALIGARWDDDAGVDSGSAYVFRRDPATGVWREEAKLLAWDGQPGDNFGRSAVISGDLALVGAHLDDDLGPDSGSAYLYRYDPIAAAWSGEQKLLAADGAASHEFGLSLAFSDTLVLVGAREDDDVGPSSGSAYLFRQEQTAGVWQEIEKLHSDDGEAGDRFGQAVALSGTRAVISALGDDDRGQDSGSAHVFEAARCGLTLERSGGCPGQTTLTGSGATPDGTVVALHASNPGAAVLPAGAPCAGTALGLDGSVAVGLVTRADAQGGYSFTGFLGSQECGRFAQVLDLESCCLSGVVRL